MTSQDNSFSEFLDDYFGETEEHLGSIRRDLLVMEKFVNRDRIDPHVADGLFLALHSLKGLSGMVGVHEVEQVAHAMEGALRDVKRTGAGPTENVMEAFAGGTRIIEEVLAALREHKPAPDITAILSHFTSVVAPQGPLWDCQFTPSAELSARGINVTSTRSRLQEIGQVLNATPHVAEGGRLTFTFIVASDVDESRFSAWPLDGLTVARRNPATDAAGTEPEQGIAHTAAPSNLVRVDMNRLDHLMTIVGDLVVSRGHVEESLGRLEPMLPPSAWRELQESNYRLQRDLRDLREGIMHIRMVPIAQIFERMHFVIRGLARENGKDVRLELTGQETEIDKVLVERMMDPLLHMVRNAVSHGLETSEERIAAGKTAEGHLRLSASTEAENVFIELEDDGRGINMEQVASRSRATGSTDVNTTDNSGVLQLLCAPGFSTREEADLGAGRGVGMTIVKAAINSLEGTLSMDTRPGKGTRFIIRLPLTLAIMQALIVYVDEQPFAVPRSSIHEVLRVERSAVRMQDGAEVTSYGDGVLPILYLRRLFNMSGANASPLGPSHQEMSGANASPTGPSHQDMSGANASPTGRSHQEMSGANASPIGRSHQEMNGESKDSFHVFVTNSAFGAIGIAVDKAAGFREIVVRRLQDSFVRVQGIAGATDLGDGRPVLILGVAAIVETAMTPRVAL